jgi:GNAT superfamily N-acetyltransferase
MSMARKDRKPAPECHPLTPDRWADLEKLFGPRGACGGCWCMVWRLPRKEFDAGKTGGNREALRALVTAGGVPGILGYLDGEPVAWCSVQPRSAFPYLARSRALPPLDDVPVWSVSCLLVDKKHRRKGLSVAMLRAAVAHVREKGGRVVEGYPIEPKKDDVAAVFAWTGLASAFAKAGFVEAGRGPTGRPIMRYVIEPG